MLRDKNIIFFAPETWDGLWRGRQKLMYDFARFNRVLYVESRKHLRPTLKHWQSGELRLTHLRQPLLRRINETAELYVFHYPKWAPICGRFPLNLATKWIRRSSLRMVIRQLKMSTPIVWISRPGMVDLLDAVPEASLRIYHVEDDYTSYTNVSEADRQRIEIQEQDISTRVDVIVTVSERLYTNNRERNSNTFLVPNGVDFQAYSDALNDSSSPAQLDSIEPPRLGYIGLIGDKLEFDMLINLARKHPEWSLVLIGEVRVISQCEKLDYLSALPNVHFLDIVPAHQVPDYVKGFQVGLMPYTLGSHADHISPLKMYEYLAAGIPIASIDIPAVKEFEGLIHTTTQQEDFPDVVAAALADNSPERNELRRRAASQHTWEAREELLSQIIESFLTRDLTH